MSANKHIWFITLGFSCKSKVSNLCIKEQNLNKSSICCFTYLLINSIMGDTHNSFIINILYQMAISYAIPYLKDTHPFHVNCKIESPKVYMITPHPRFIWSHHLALKRLIIDILLIKPHWQKIRKKDSQNSHSVWRNAFKIQICANTTELSGDGVNLQNKSGNN